MKKQRLPWLALALLCGTIQGQHLIRVNNNAAAGADYATLQEANDNASDGDTIYLEGSTTHYEGATLSRRLAIIGPGYFLSENDSTQANGLEAVIQGNITFSAGSEGSTMTGCSVPGYYTYIGVSDITVSRCRLFSIEISGEVENILVFQNYLYWFNVPYNFKISNSIVANNIVQRTIIASESSGPLQVINNVVEPSFDVFSIYVFNSSVANNIVCNASGSIAVNTGNTITNNILAYEGTNSNGNLHNVAMANVFVDFDGTLGYSSDGRWQLKAGSPALGAGVGGVDCGAFGGVTPYVLSGLPPLPHIYEAAIPGTAYSGDGLPVTIRVKSGK